MNCFLVLLFGIPRNRFPHTRTLFCYFLGSAVFFLESDVNYCHIKHGMNIWSWAKHFHIFNQRCSCRTF